MLHRAILGSFERFLGVMIEHYAGRFPLWLAPVQAVVATIVSDADDYAGEVAGMLRKAGLTVELDLSNQKINAKVREHSLAHVPVLVVVGRREAEQRTVALRRLGGEAQEVLPLDEAVQRACGRGDATRSEGSGWICPLTPHGGAWAAEAFLSTVRRLRAAGQPTVTRTPLDRTRTDRPN